jgi:ABC-2 type transport system permease protein
VEPSEIEDNGRRNLYRVAVSGSIWRMVAIARKEFVHISRDWRTLVAVLVFPIIMLLAFGYAISFDVTNVPTVVLDQDHTVLSRAYVSAAEKTRFFHVVGSVGDLAGIDKAFDQSVARAAIVVAPGYADDIAAGRKGRVTVLLDGSEPNSAQLGQTYAVALDNTLSQQTLVSWAERQGRSLSGVGQLQPRIRNWYNPEARSADYLVPALMVVIVMIVTVQQTSVTLVRERESGTLEQLLQSPLTQGELIVGKVAPFALLGFVDTVVITLAALLVFQVPLRGDVAVLAIGMFLFILCCLSIGLIVSAVAPTIESANMIALLISFLPSFMLSGLAFPLASIPPVLQFVSMLFPARYMVEIARGIFLRGTGWAATSTQVLALAIYAAVGLTSAALLNRRRT